jgi:hypothetical protein
VLRVSVGFRAADRDLDKVLVDIVMTRQVALGRSSRAPLDQHLHINRTSLISPEAISESVIEVIKAKRFAASLIRPIEERAMLALGWHTKPAIPGGPPCYRPQGPGRMNGRRT